MCSFHTWYYDESAGYVLQCKECMTYQVGFGMLMLSFNNEEFIQFHSYVGAMLAGAKPETNAGLKCFMVHTPHQSVQLLLCKRELEKLHYMLEQADNEVKVHQLLQLFNHDNTTQ